MRTKTETAKRYILFIISLFISALGIAATKKAELGISPISSVANVLSLRFDFLSFGNWLIIWNCMMILGQIILLRKDFKPIQLLQVPLSFLFGYFTDFGMWLMSFIPYDSYIIRLALVFIGTAVLGFGIALSVVADVIMNSGEALVKAIADKTHFVFGNVKIAFDISCVVSAAVLSLILLSFTIQGIREGTVISAVLTGMTVKFFVKITKEPIEKILVK